MKATRKLASWTVLCVVSIFVSACDYYEPPEIPFEQNNTSDTSNKIRSVSNEDKITLYAVDGEDIIKIEDYEVEGELLEFQEDVAKHQEIWELTKKIIPLSYRLKMSEFLIYHGDQSNTSGFVDPTLNNLSKWQFAIAIDYAYQGGFNKNGETTFTIIHEFGHLLTLNNEQITPGVISNNCQNFYFSKGCAKTESHINSFHEAYWSDIWDEYSSLKDTEAAKSSFYEKYRTRYVSKYAAADPREDIAEVFATFVLSNEVPTGNAIANQKIQMMYKNADLSDLRVHIRQHAFVAKQSVFLNFYRNSKQHRCLLGL
jgi:hypothetical protein